VTIGNSVKSIGEEAFTYCSILTSVTIGNSVTSIGDSAFAYTALETVTIGKSVKSIGDYAFYRSGLTQVVLPCGVTIGMKAFGPHVAIVAGYDEMVCAGGRFDVALEIATSSSGLLEIAAGERMDAVAMVTSRNDAVHSTMVGAFEDDFEKQCRVVAEMAERGGALMECMCAIRPNFDTTICTGSFYKEMICEHLGLSETACTYAIYQDQANRNAAFA